MVFLFLILFTNILFLKEFLPCNGYFGLFNKIKKGSVTSLWCTFSAWFSNENVPYLILYQWTKFQYLTFFTSQVIKQNLLISSYLDSWWRNKLWGLSSNNLSERVVDLTSVPVENHKKMGNKLYVVLQQKTGKQRYFGWTIAFLFISRFEWIRHEFNPDLSSRQNGSAFHFCLSFLQDRIG